MKKLLFVIALLFGLFVQAQNQDIINKMMESKTIEDIKTVTNDIVSKRKNKYNFYKNHELQYSNGEKIENFIYTKEGITDVEKKEIYSPIYKNCLVITFGKWEKGQNKDLEIPGELVYYFKNVSGSYMELVEFWRTTFYPNSTKEEILDSFTLKEYRVNKDLKYKLQKDIDKWKIVKSY